MNLNAMKFFVFLLTFWCPPVESNKEAALFFDWKNKQLVEMSKYIDEANCTFCLSTCPADPNSSRETLIQEKISITGDGIFLRNFYKNTKLLENAKMDICETAPKPALVWDTILKQYETGYELYFEEGSLEETDCMWYSHFTKVINGEPHLNSNPKEKPNKDVIIHEDETQKNTKFELVKAQGKNIVFHWISVLFIEVSSSDSNGTQRLVIYSKDTINDFFHNTDSVSHCLDYFTGDGRNILLVHENPFKGQENAANRWVKTEIIPMLMFHTVSARHAICTYLNIAFVWRSIANGQLRKVDLFLYELYKSSPSYIDISFGVNGDTNTLKDEIVEEDALLQKYPVPEILFRIIEYKFGEEKYAASVVIHNDLEPIGDTDRICLAQARGWDRIKNENATTGISYACSLTPDVLKRLGFSEKWGHLSKLKPLELNEELQQSSWRIGNVLGKVRGMLNQFKDE